MIKGS